MNHGGNLSRTTDTDSSSDIYQPSEPAESRQLRGPGTPGGPSSSTTPNRGTHVPSVASATIGTPLPVIADLDAIVEQFRGQRVSKPHAIGLISSKLVFAADQAEPDKDNALLQYLSLLDSIESLATEATRRGANVIQQDQSQPVQGAPSRQTPQPSRGANDGETGEQFEELVSEEVARHKRNRGGTEPEHHDSYGEIEEADGASNKRQRLFEKNMPWFARESMARITANPSCLATRDTLSHFAVDYSAVKHWILSAQSTPRGFPSTEWDHIIRGKPVDLDVVLSSLHHVYPVKETTGRLGSTEISLGRTEPSRRVRTCGEWTSAWNATTKAYIFAFPHREDELRQYGDHIDREFASKVVSAHKQIILYDAAVRDEVAGGSSILLTDRTSFSYIYSAIVLPNGIEAEHGQTQSKSNSKNQSDICRRFNSTTGCPNQASTCRYQHLCSKCRRRGHTSHECKKDEGNNAKPAT